MSTVTPGRFVWHELMTTDVPAAQKFYEEVVGWKAQPFPGTEMEYSVWMAGETGVGGLMKLPAEAAAMGTPPMWVPYISVADADATAEQIKKLGGHVHKKPHFVPGVGNFGIMGDPQGAVFAILTPDQPETPETDPKPLEFSWRELITTDLDAGQKFYREIFGWVDKDVHDMGPEMGPYKMFGRDRFTYGGMFKKPANLPAPSHWMSYAFVDSADAAAERATKAGGTVINGPMDVPGGDRIATILDPQGAAFSVHSKGKKS